MLWTLQELYGQILQNDFILETTREFFVRQHDGIEKNLFGWHGDAAPKDRYWWIQFAFAVEQRWIFHFSEWFVRIWIARCAFDPCPTPDGRAATDCRIKTTVSRFWSRDLYGWILLMLCKTKVWSLMMALSSTIDSRIRTPGPMETPGPIDTFGPSCKR